MAYDFIEKSVMNLLSVYLLNERATIEIIPLYDARYTLR